MKEIQINSLSEYVDKIEKYPSTDYLFRGEPQKYYSRTAAALRNHKSNYGEPKKIYPFNKMLDDFYREVTPRLSHLEHENFIAFAQHYGIPTPLVDITESPLIALYFACQGNLKEDGYVYAFNNNYIDITDIVQMYPNKNVIEELFINSKKNYLDMLPLLENYRNSYKDEFVSNMEALFDEYLYYFNSESDDTAGKLAKELSQNRPHLKELAEDVEIFETDSDKIGYISGELHLWQVWDYLEELDPEMPKTLLDDYSMEVIIYLNLAKQFFRESYDYGEPIWWINFLPNMVYNPIINFDRGLSQSGLFLYQAYASYVEEAYNFRVQMVQRIKVNNPVFVIRNKSEILKSLDNIGINKMTIFKDFDSTASYIKNKYEELHGF